MALPHERNNAVRIQLEESQQQDLARASNEAVVLRNTAGSAYGDAYLLEVQDILDGVLSGSGTASVVQSGALAPSALRMHAA